MPALESQIAIVVVEREPLVFEVESGREDMISWDGLQGRVDEFSKGFKILHPSAKQTILNDNKQVF